jgi:hypothetical protein
MLTDAELRAEIEWARFAAAAIKGACPSVANSPEIFERSPPLGR